MKSACVGVLSIIEDYKYYECVSVLLP